MQPIFTFSSSRDFLRAYVSSLPKKGWGELQRWSQHLGVQTSYLSQVLSGAKNFSTEYGLKLGKYIGLTGIELDYFVLLIEKERAGTIEAREYFEEKVKQTKKESKHLVNHISRDRILTEGEMAVFYSSWKYSAVRLYCSGDDGKTAQQIRDYFDLPKEECTSILDFLTETGLCKKEKNKYFMGVQKTHVDRESLHVRRHWINWHLQAVNRIESVDESDLIYSAPFSISKDDFETLRAELTLFIKNFVKRVEKSQVEDLAFLNIDLLKIKK